MMTFRYVIIFITSLFLVACQALQGELDARNIPINIEESSASSPASGVDSVSDHTSEISILSSKSAIKKLQGLLLEKGYNPNGIDGNVGPGTKKAIKAYQRDNHLSADGLASVSLLNHIKNKQPNTSTSALTSDITQCITSNNQDLQSISRQVFSFVLDDLQVDVDSYLKGFCVPTDKNTLARLYLFLVTEGVIHSRIAEINYNELIAVYKKAGVSIAFIEDSYRRSTGDKLISDIKVTAKDRWDGADTLVENSYSPEDNSEFQNSITKAYEDIEPDSPYKEQARQLLSKVLEHSSASAFYLVRSGYAIDQLSKYFGVDLSDGISIGERANMFVGQAFENYNLASFLLSKQDDLSAMLVSSTYSIQALTQDVKDIPRTDPKVATQEVRQFKKEGGLTLDEMEIEFDQENVPTNFS